MVGRVCLTAIAENATQWGLGATLICAKTLLVLVSTTDADAMS